MKFFNRVLTLLAMFAALCLMAGYALAQSDEGSMSDEEKMWRSIRWVEAGSDVPLGSEAHVMVPEGYIFTGRQGTQTLMKLYGNLLTEWEQGYIEPLDENEMWFLVFEYENSGHVKDDEADDLDADAIMKSFKDSDDASNEERKRLGYPDLNTKGWLVPPYYNDQTHNLEWALLLESGGEEVVNYNIRLLGREGIMHVTVVTGVEEFEDVRQQVPTILEGFAFNPGRTYAEYQEGDKLADYGLMALLGAGAAGAAIGIFAKYGKVIIAAIVAAGASVLAFIRKLFGRKKQ